MVPLHVQYDFFRTASKEVLCMSCSVAVLKLVLCSMGNQCNSSRHLVELSYLPLFSTIFADIF